MFLLLCVTLQVFEDSCRSHSKPPSSGLGSVVPGQAVSSIERFLMTLSWWILPHQCFSSMTPTGQTLPNRQGAVKLLK